MTLPLGEIWQHGEKPNQLPPEWPRYSVGNAAPGQQIGPISYVADEATMRRYGAAIGIPTGIALFPTVPARHTDILRHVDGGVSGSVNTRMMMELFQPVRPGDVLTLSGQIIAVYERRGKPYLTVQAETRNQDGVVVERLRKTVVTSLAKVRDKWTFLQTPSQ
jgi:hypothetical protein